MKKVLSGGPTRAITYSQAAASLPDPARPRIGSTDCWADRLPLGRQKPANPTKLRMHRGESGQDSANGEDIRWRRKLCLRKRSHTEMMY
jgi:hypothetical protein